MSTAPGGWKCSQVVFTSEEIQAYDAGAELVSYYLKKISDCFVESGLWEYDSTIHSGNTNPIQINNTDKMWAHACFFNNKQTNTKAMLAYCFTGSPVNQSLSYIGIDRSAGWPGALMFSFIPVGKATYNPTETFGSRAFLGNNNNSLFVCGTCFDQTKNTTTVNKNSTNNLSGTLQSLAGLYKANFSCWFKYSFVQKDDAVMIIQSNSVYNSQSPQITIFGRLCDADTVARPTEETELPESLYGMCLLNEWGNNSGNPNYEFYNGTINILDNNRLWKAGRNGPGFILRKAQVNENTYTDAQYYSDVNGPYLGNLESRFSGIDNLNLLNANQTIGPNITEGWERLSPIQVSYGLPGTGKYVYETQKDNFRGFIRTDMLLTCPARYQVNQTFGDGNYIYVGNGLCVGWDKTLNAGVQI